jgi:hypothetical protein
MKMPQKTCPRCQGRRYVWKPILVWDKEKKKFIDNGHEVECPECHGRGSNSCIINIKLEFIRINMKNKIVVNDIDLEVMYAHYEAALSLIRELIRNEEKEYLNLWDNERAKKYSIAFNINVEADKN